jgi:23S rRNA (adenine2503-C2)-methyltransferase
MMYFQSLTQNELAELLIPLSRAKHMRRGDDFATLPTEIVAEIDNKARKTAKYRAQQIYHWVYQRFVFDWDQMSDLSKDLRGWLKENIEIYRLKDKYNKQALDGTHKFLWELPDGKTIESVIIPAALQEKDSIEDDGSTEIDSEHVKMKEGRRFAGAPTLATVDSGRWSRLTVCISSQVGCAMACKFCLTGIQGLDRHLQAHEIVAQVMELKARAPLTNIVFMGMGEPLHNFENVVKACEIMLDTDGMNFSKRKVTVSTSGLVPAIEALGKRVDVSLAISLNSSTDEQRSELMPVNKRWNLAALMKACREYPLSSHRRITFEYVMIKGFNDTLEDAARVIKLVQGIPAKINLIPFNEHPGADYKRPADETVKAFQRYLMDRNLTTTVRISRGRDILAACGQLRSIFGTARGTEKHRDYKTAEAAPAAEA